MPLADIRPALRAFLLADTAVSAAVGGQRIFASVLPQAEARTSLVYNRITELTDHHTQGASGLVAVRMQLDAWSPLPDDADALARAVKLRIDGYRGLMGAIEVQGVFADTVRDDYQADIKMYRVSRDYWVHYGER